MHRVAAASLLLLSFASFSILLQACVFEDDLLVDSPVSRAHSRVHALILLLQTILVVQWAFQPSKWLLTLFNGVGLSLSGVIVYGFVTLLPSYDLGLAQLEAATSALIFWASICRLLNQFTSDSLEPGAATAFFVGLPLFLLLAILLVRSRIDQLTLRSASKIQNVYEVELKVRITRYEKGKGLSY